MCPLCRSIWRHSQCVFTHTLHVSPVCVCLLLCFHISVCTEVLLGARWSIKTPQPHQRCCVCVKVHASVHSRVCRETHYRYHAIAHALNNINQRLPELTRR